jgi:hypothetical protein
MDAPSKLSVIRKKETSMHCINIPGYWCRDLGVYRRSVTTSGKLKKKSFVCGNMDPLGAIARSAGAPGSILTNAPVSFSTIQEFRPAPAGEKVRFCHECRHHVSPGHLCSEIIWNTCRCKAQVVRMPG